MRLNRQIAAQQRQMVLQAGGGGITPQKVLEVTARALAWGDYLVHGFEAEELLPQPVACEPGCHFCCFNQVEVTPPEALLLGHHIENSFSGQERAGLTDRVNKALAHKAGKSKEEIARSRRQSSCPLLHGGLCSVYPARPLMCRAMHSVDARECERSRESQDLRSVPYYAHRDEIYRSVSQGLLAGFGGLGCRVAVLDLARALEDYFRADRAMERWLAGERVFGNQ